GPLSFLNAASGQQGVVSPTALLNIYGTGLSSGLQGCVAANQILGPLPLALSNVQVQFTASGYSAFAPLFSLCNFGPGQEFVVAQVPADLPMDEITVTVQVSGAPIGHSTTTAVAAGPGIFQTVMSDGKKRAILQRADGTFISLENPAQRAERLR